METKNYVSKKVNSGSMKNSKRKITKYLENMEIKHNFPNIWDTAKAVIRDNCITIQANYKKEKTQINNLT